MKDDSFGLGPCNAAVVARLFEDFRANPESVSAEWQAFFRGWSDGDGTQTFPNRAESRVGTIEEYRRPSLKDAASGNESPRPDRVPDAASADGDRSASVGGENRTAILQDRADQIVRVYRVRGHMIARIDPLGLPRIHPPELDPAHYGLTDEDMDRQVSSRTIAGPDVRTLGELLRRMHNTYCRSIGVQFMHIDDLDTRHWLQERMEGTENRIELSRDEQLRILSSLTKAVVFEESLQRKYVGAKTFSLEGCESLIPLLDLAIERAAEGGIREIVIGMAHRGRLNVLANVMGKSAADIFHEFDDPDPTAHLGTGDVKYHLGYGTDRQTADGRHIHLSLCFNPSHLEFINPVAMGRMRAKQDRAGDARRETGMVLLIHGDAAFIGEGIVQESLNLSELAAYTVGGTLHVIVNNQIGFTTSPSEGRSCLYATDVAKMLQIPIFHVNGEDPEAVAQVVRLAMAFRTEFKRDVVIDMYGYRRHGHNEVDEPSYTQPVMYRAIRERKSVREGYLDHLLKLGQIGRDEAEKIAVQYHNELEDSLTVARSDLYVPPTDKATGIWARYRGGLEDGVEEIETGVDGKRLVELLRRMFAVPDSFQPHPRFVRFTERREEMARGDVPLDWSAGEALAFATLATDGFRVRLTGQDSERGTFSHRHAVLHDYESGATYPPMQFLTDDQAPVEIYNSPLSEAGVLGFEYGYSLDYPDALVMWEAQFGDFVNAAQVIIDQFIVSGEDKRKRLSGLALLLPHGYEGQGPEHSSAYIERFLVMAAEHNVQIAQPSTPAQMFHLLRRQVLRPWRKPLIVFTPKSLLRHPAAVSSLDELAAGSFQRVIPEWKIKPAAVRRILLCAGKVYYALIAARNEQKRSDVAIIRIEQFYPMRIEDIAAALAHYADGTPAFWVQEEPRNMGAWQFLREQFGDRLLGRFPFSGIHRPESASPATGSHAAHKYEQEHLIREALGDA